MRRVGAIAVALAVLATGAAAQWKVTDRVAASYFFYWYDVSTGQHFRDPDGSDAMTHHPPDSYLSDYSWNSVSWHVRELEDMMAAGIDVALPDYWGDSGNAWWARPGVERLVQAAQTIAWRGGPPPPRIGLFLDTNALLLQNGGVPPDLTTVGGKQLLFSFARDFFDRVPAALRATIDGRLLVVFYNAGFVGRYDALTLADFNARLQARYGVKAFLVLDQSWQGVTADGVYPWGVAYYGPSVAGTVGSLGPGYDETAVYGRTEPRVRNRNCGEYYADGWELMSAGGARLVLVETWNELHEGTDVAPTREFGRTYLDLTGAAVRRWKAAPDPATAAAVWVDLGARPYLAGVRPAFNRPDGAWRSVFAAGREGVQPDRSTTPPSYYVYLDVADGFQFAAAREAWVTVEYLDTGTDAWWVDYDGTAGAYTASERVQLGNTGGWKRHTFHLADAYFGGRQWGADLRLCDGWDDGHTNAFGRVWVSAAPPVAVLPDLFGGGTLRLRPGEVRDVPLLGGGGAAEPAAVSIVRGEAVGALRVGYGGSLLLRLAPQAPHDGCTFLVTVVGSGTAGGAAADAVSFRVEVGGGRVRRLLH